MKRHAILHIGPMKTGSTSIQHWLHVSTEMLAANGVHVAQGLGRNMSRLAPIVIAHVLGEAPVPSDVERLNKFADEVAKLPDSVHTLVLSGEMLGQQLHRVPEVRALKEIMDQYCDSYTVVTYLRRQDELSVSRYSTALRRGDLRARPLSQAINYERLLHAWSTVFGRESMRVRIFDRSSLLDGDVVPDFAQTAGLPYEPISEGAVEQNPSIRPEAQQFLHLLVERAKEEGITQRIGDLPWFERIGTVLANRYPGPGKKPPRKDALEFYETVRESNERARQEWFPERKTLFKEDFSSYPEVPTAPPAREVLDVALTVLARLLTEQREATNDPESEMKRALYAKIRQRRRGNREGAGRRGRRNATSED